MHTPGKQPKPNPYCQKHLPSSGHKKLDYGAIIHGLVAKSYQ